MPNPLITASAPENYLTASSMAEDFSVLFEKNPNPMWIYEVSSLRILRVNEAAIENYGYSESEFLSMTFKNLHHSCELEKLNYFLDTKGVQNGTLTGFNNAGIWQHQNKKGDIIYVEITSHQLYYGNAISRIVTATNVTYEVLERQDIKLREGFLTSLLDSQTNFLIRMDANGCFTFANQQFFKSFGFKNIELIGTGFSQFAIPEEKYMCEQTLRNCIANPGKVTHLTNKMPDKNGDSHWIKWEFVSIINDAGELSAIQGIGHDVTAKLESEKEVKRTTNKLDTFIESITDAFYILDTDWKFIRVNKEFERLSKLNRNDLLGKIIWEVFPMLVGTGFETAYLTAMREQRSVRFTEHISEANLWFDTTVYPSSEGITIFVKDLTQERKALEEIAWTKNNLEGIINNTQDLIWSIDKEGRYVYMNNAYRTKIETQIGKAPQPGEDAYAHSGDTETVNELWRSFYSRAFSGERYVTIHDSIDPVTKSKFTYEVSFNPIFKTNKKDVTGVGCFAHDITARLNTEKALMNQNERLRHIASLSSHELRRPVASMLGLMNVMDRNNISNPDNKQIIEHLYTVTQEIDEVIRLIVNKTFI
jgi:PAS domain S-box-containing protein